MRYRENAFLLLVVMSWMSLAAHNIHAQGDDGLSYVRADNGVIAVLAEKTSGQFRIEAAGGAPLLFRSGKGVTAYTNLHFGNNTWTTNLLHRAAPPSGTRGMTGVRVEERSDRIHIEAVIRNGTDSVRFLQDLIPSLDGDYAYVNIVTSVENLSGRPVTAGLLQLLDIMIGEADSVDLTVGGFRVLREREWSGAAVPDSYEARAAGSPYLVRGRLRSATADAPDRLIAGNWQFSGYLGTLAWDYTPSGRVLTDDAVALRWDDTPIPPGGSRTVRADYGYITYADVELLCSADALGYTADSSAYAPDPLTLRATVRNTGTLPDRKSVV